MPRLLLGLVASTILVISSAISWKAGAATVASEEVVACNEKLCPH